MSNKLLSLINMLCNGDNKVVNVFKKAIEIANSGKYPQTMSGYMQIANDFGFNKEAVNKMRSYASNPMFINALNSVAPGAASKLKTTFNEFSSKIDESATHSSASSPDDFMARFNRLK